MIVDVAVVAADAVVQPPWERCVGETNVGLGLRRVGIAVRKAPRTDAPAYVVDARISATRPGTDRGWTACAQLHGANPSLSSGALTGSLRASLVALAPRRRAQRPRRTIGSVTAHDRHSTKALGAFVGTTTTQFPADHALIDAVSSRRGQARLYGVRAPPMKAPPRVLASWAGPPPRLADLAFG